MSQGPPGCLGAFLKLLGVDTGRPQDDGGTQAPLPYRMRDEFLSPAELAFFQVLKATAQDQFHVCAKVRVSDLLYVADRRNNMAHANKIDRKHVDFVLCRLGTMAPAIVIELDDSSHQQPDRQSRDELVDSAFEAAGLPILHVPWQRSYSADGLLQEIQSKLGNGTDAVGSNSEPHLPQTQFPAAPKQTNEMTDHQATPTCPQCNVEMVQRQASRGIHKGKRFWACPSYPECKRIVAID